MTLTELAGLITGLIVGWATIKSILWLKNNWNLMNIQRTEDADMEEEWKCYCRRYRQ
jgi:hypothetical protein